MLFYILIRIVQLNYKSHVPFGQIDFKYYVSTPELLYDKKIILLKRNGMLKFTSRYYLHFRMSG